MILRAFIPPLFFFLKRNSHHFGPRKVYSTVIISIDSESCFTRSQVFHLLGTCSWFSHSFILIRFPWYVHILHCRQTSLDIPLPENNHTASNFAFYANFKKNHKNPKLVRIYLHPRTSKKPKIPNPNDSTTHTDPHLPSKRGQNHLILTDYMSYSSSFAHYCSPPPSSAAQHAAPASTSLCTTDTSRDRRDWTRSDTRRRGRWAASWIRRTSSIASTLVL